MYFTIFKKKKMPFQAIKTKSSKSRKIDILLKGLTHGFGTKMANFPQTRKLSFKIFQNEKMPVQAIKTRCSRSRKIDILLKGLTMVLVQKWPFFQLFSLCNIGLENTFYDILERKNAFVIYKNKKFKKSKNFHLSKGVNPWFWSKNAHFSNPFFQAIQTRKFLLRCSRMKKNDFLGYKNKKFKNSTY